MIEVQDLTHYYGGRRAIEGLSFKIAENEIVGFLGLNGAGKSTTLKILAGLIVPTAGSVKIDGLDVVTANHEFRGRIGYLPEDPPLYKDMSVSGFVRFCGQLKGMSTADVDSRLPSVLETTQLTLVRDRTISELSHGYRKRVGIAQAIIHNPRLVILDEPISGLDPRQIVEMRKVVRALGRDRTVLISSHILSEISETCDRMLVLAGGVIAAQGTEAEISRLGTERAVRLDLLLSGDNKAIEAALRPFVGAEPVRIVADGAYWKVEVNLGSDTREALVAALVGAGIGVRRLVEDAGELEQVFLGLTREVVS